MFSGSTVIVSDLALISLTQFEWICVRGRVLVSVIYMWISSFLQCMFVAPVLKIRWL
jgi:hypothetical protein